MLHVFDNLNTLFNSLADFVVTKSKEAIARDGRFSFVLSGGSSPKRLYKHLTTEPYCTQIEWNKVDFFFGDERYVPATDPQSNYLMAKETLFDPLKISENQIFGINTALSPEAAALSYQKNILTYFKDKPTCFDLTLLGLGDNVHTASLFPHSTILHEQHDYVKAVFVDEVNMDRITLTAPIINKSNTIVFLVYGTSKAEAVKHVIEDATDIERYPAQLIHPASGELHWFLDEEAANYLTQD